ncbi:MAG TPA: dual specificity protein phosphatase family protein [Ktedonobacterales bacterium]|jgi:atypical dual specificity phosphatase
MRGFYWIIEEALAGSGQPGWRGRGQGLGAPAPHAAQPNDLDEDLAWLRGRGIGAILSLTETPLPEEALARQGFVSRHVPVRDMTAPAPEQLEEALEFIDQQRARGRRVLVHCLVGQGRTGTVLAAYLIRAGMAPEAALAHLRSVCPDAVSSGEQQRALAAFAERRDWIA